MNRTSKVAVSLPKGTLRELDRSCKRKGFSRSAAVSEAVSQWLRAGVTLDEDGLYSAGYRDQPEVLPVFAEASVAMWDSWE
jgi:metal-responsive CopG/Arc/MetJ family transcriptional regulator